jgi:hypothetical protein
MKLNSFENCIEHFALEDANKFYHDKKVPINSTQYCIMAANEYNRDEEEALVLYSTLFPHAFHYIGEIENIKRNAI